MKTIPLAKLCDIIIGKTPSRSTESYWGNGVKWATIADLKEKYIENTKEEITSDAVEMTHSRLIPEGTVLLSFKLSIGKTSITKTQLCTNEAIAALIIKDQTEICSEYLYYALKSINYVGNNAAKGTVLNSKILANLRIPMPDSLDEQKEIVDILSRIDSVIDKRKHILETLDYLVDCVFHKMFGEPTVIGHQMKSKLGDYIGFITSGSRDWAKYYSTSGDLFLRINNIGKAELKLKEKRYVNAPSTLEAARAKVRSGDLLFSITADLGRTAVIDASVSGAYISQHVALIRLDSRELLPEYVAWFFVAPYGKKTVQKYAKGGVKSGLNLDDIKKMDIYVPPYENQKTFSRILKQVQQLKAYLQENLTEFETLLESTSKGLFTSLKSLDHNELSHTDESSDINVKPTVNYEELLINHQPVLASNEVMSSLFNEDASTIADYERVKELIFRSLSQEDGRLNLVFDKASRTIRLKVN